MIGLDFSAAFDRVNHEALLCSDRILTFGIRSILSPAKVGIGYYKAVKLPAQ